MLNRMKSEMHMLKLVKYINQRGGVATNFLHPVNYIVLDLSNYKTLFKQLLVHEEKKCLSINDLVALHSTDRIAAHIIFLQWYVAEQIEEEAEMPGIF
jgi:ferritin